MVFPFMEFSVYGKKDAKKLAANFLLLFSLLCYRPVVLIFTFFFRLLCQTTIIEKPSLNRYEEATCENCGTQIAKPNLARHKKSCSVGTLYCTQCPNFLTKSQNDLKYHIATKLSAQKPDVTLKCELCYQQFPGIYVLGQHRNTQHAMQIGTGTRDVDVEHIVGDVEDHRLREELRSCQHFLVDSELERARHKVFNYAVETLNETIMNEKRPFFQQFEMCTRKESGFWFHSENHRSRRIQILLRTRKQYLAGSTQTCVHP